MIGWDARVFWRAAALAALGLLIAWLVTAASDEGGVGWGIRAGRALPVAPLCAAVGAALALLPARARDEIRALEALGRGPFRNGLAAAAGGSAVALAAAIALAGVPAVSIDGFFPTLGRAGLRVEFADGAFVDPARGVRILSDGSFDHAGPVAAVGVEERRLPPGARASSALATALAGAALPLVCAGTLVQRRRAWLPAIAVAGTAVASIVLFHLAAARVVPSLAACAPALALLSWSFLRYRAPP